MKRLAHQLRQTSLLPETALPKEKKPSKPVTALSQTSTVLFEPILKPPPLWIGIHFPDLAIHALELSEQMYRLLQLIL